MAKTIGIPALNFKMARTAFAQIANEGSGRNVYGIEEAMGTVKSLLRRYTWAAILKPWMMSSAQWCIQLDTVRAWRQRFNLGDN